MLTGMSAPSYAVPGEGCVQLGVRLYSHHEARMSAVDSLRRLVEVVRAGATQ